MSLSSEQTQLCQAFSKSCRRSILQMVANAKSGHPGGSLSMIDFLSVLYTQIIGKTGEHVVVSNGHVSPSVYATLAEMGYVNKEEVITTLRQYGSIFEGHVTRHIPGISVGTGPLGAGVSMAAGLAVAEQKKLSGKRVFATIGDGEAQEGQVYETFLFAAQQKLNNFIVFVDYNEVQLTASLKEIMNTDIVSIGNACGWNVLEIDGHNYTAIAQSLEAAGNESEKPTLIVGKTIMGKGVHFMEQDGRDLKASWHGKAPSQEDVAISLENELKMTEEEETILDEFRSNGITWKPDTPEFTTKLSEVELTPASPRVYAAEELTDCRSAYGKALLDLAHANKNIIALSADLQGSVMTKFVASELPEQHVEVGIAEQNLVSASGGMSLNGFIPFCSTFGAFMGSRAKDQARLNDINQTNVKMVATHCGLSAGPDGPTHQAIDDAGSFLGMFNTHICEPADPNHCDRIIKYVARKYGNFYVRMGRHKIPVLTHEDGSIFFDEHYEYQYGKCDILRTGKDIVIVATGGTVIEALRARENFSDPKRVEIVIASSIKQFDKTLIQSLQKAKYIITCEDHNPTSGLSTAIKSLCIDHQISPIVFKTIAVKKYQLSGNDRELYRGGEIDAQAIEEALNEF